MLLPSLNYTAWHYTLDAKKGLAKYTNPKLTVSVHCLQQLLVGRIVRTLQPEARKPKARRRHKLETLVSCHLLSKPLAQRDVVAHHALQLDSTVPAGTKLTQQCRHTLPVAQ
jgi:hypothetical protein